ncbi:MAG: PAS domain-containing protein [Desulfobacterales bacterium]|nr:PAS domain-containing protein [Desulfobacterales bacterium]
MLNLKSIIDNLPSTVIVVDADRRIIMANKMAQLFSGENEDGLIGKRGGDVMGCVHTKEPPQGCGYSKACKFCEATNAVVRAFREKVDIKPFETLIETEQRGPLDLKFTVTLLKKSLVGHANMSAPAALVTVDNMTEYKKRERLEAMMATVGTICHEMNQPLMVLTGQLDLLEMDIGKNSRIDVFREQLERMSITTKKLLSMKSYATKPYLNNSLRILDMEKTCV